MKNYIKSLPKWAHITGSSALAVLILYLVFRDKVDAFLIDQLEQKELISYSDIDLDKTLKKGSRGLEVKRLQEQLTADGLGDIVGNTDGIFGKKTEAALLERFDVSQISLNQYRELYEAERKSRMDIKPTSKA
jgi:hypothetical protein